MGKTKPYMVNAKTIRTFIIGIAGKNGAEKEAIIKETMERSNLTRKGAEKSVERAIKFGRIIEKNGKLYPKS